MLGFEDYAAPQSYEDDGVSVVPLKFDMLAEDWKKVKRADLVFEDVGHIGMSYEVRAYFNNKKANADTPRTAAEGYAGRFTVFGHGNCFGAAGHCDASGAVAISRAQGAVAPLQHPAQPHKRLLTVTEAFHRVMKRYRNGIHSLTLVTILQAPRRKDCKPQSGLFKCRRVSIQVYS